MYRLYVQYRTPWRSSRFAKSVRLHLPAASLWTLDTIPIKFRSNEQTNGLRSEHDHLPPPGRNPQHATGNSAGALRGQGRCRNDSGQRPGTARRAVQLAGVARGHRGQVRRSSAGAGGGAGRCAGPGATRHRQHRRRRRVSRRAPHDRYAGPARPARNIGSGLLHHFGERRNGVVRRGARRADGCVAPDSGNDGSG